MTTAILRPIGPGDAAACTRVGAGLTANWQAVDEDVADDNTSYVFAQSATLTDYYTIDPSSIPEGSVINQIDVTARAHTTDTTSDTNSAVGPGVRLGGVDNIQSQNLFDIGAGSSVWQTFSKTNLSRPGGGSWTREDLDTLQIALNCAEFSAGTQARCTQVFLTVDYTEPAVPEVTDVQPRQFSNGDIVEITGTGFKAAQGNGKVELGDNHEYVFANKKQQVIDHWEDIAIRFITDKGSLPNGQVFVFVTNDDGQTNDPPPPGDPGDLDTEIIGYVIAGSGRGNLSTEKRLEIIYAAVAGHTAPDGAGRSVEFLMQRIGRSLGINITSGTRSFETNLILLYNNLTGETYSGNRSVNSILSAIESYL